MTQVVIKDSKTGHKNPANWYLPPAVIAALETLKDSENQTRFLLHEVTQFEAEFIEQESEDATYKELFHVPPVPNGFDFMGYKEKLKTGQAEFISRNATSFPKSSAGIRPNFSAIIPVGMGFDTNYFEQQKAQRFGMNVDAEGLRDCAEYIDDKLNEGAYFGARNPDGLEVKGLFDFCNGGGANVDVGKSFAKVAVTPGDGGSTAADMTGKELADNLLDLIDNPFYISRKKARARVVGVGLDLWKIMGKKSVIMEADSGGSIYKSVRDYLQKERPDVKWVVDSFFDSVNFNQTDSETWDGEAGSGCAVALDNRETCMQYPASDREILRPYETRGFVTTTNTYGLTAGLQVKKIYAGSYMKGLT